MSGTKNNTEGSIEQNDDQDIETSTTTYIIADIVENEVVVGHEKANSPQGG